MAEIIQIFFTYAGLTLFLGGVVFCFVAPAFRYGVFCTVLGNLFFVSAIVFPKQMVQFVEMHELGYYFTSVDILALKEKAVITGLILMAVFWIVRWFKHLAIEGFFVFLFPSLARPVVKEEKKKKKNRKFKTAKADAKANTSDTTEAFLGNNDDGSDASKDDSEYEETSHECNTTFQDAERAEKHLPDSDSQEETSDRREELPVIRVRG